MIGIDTRNVRPFELLFDAGTTNLFPTDQTLYIFVRYHTIVAYGDNGVEVYGR